MNTVDVELGNKSYTISELPTRKNEAWRGELEAFLDPLIGMLKDVSDVEVSGTNLAELIPSAELIARAAMTSPMKVRELVLAYSPELEKDADRLYEEAYDSEFTDAFTKVLGLAYPFGGLVRAIQGLSAAGS